MLILKSACKATKHLHLSFTSNKNRIYFKTRKEVTYHGKNAMLYLVKTKERDLSRTTAILSRTPSSGKKHPIQNTWNTLLPHYYYSPNHTASDYYLLRSKDKLFQRRRNATILFCFSEKNGRKLRSAFDMKLVRNFFIL